MNQRVIGPVNNTHTESLTTKTPTTMKQLMTFLTGATLVCALNAEAAIWRVNNQGYSADFTDLQFAVSHPTVNNGDTIHVEPSGVSYGTIVCAKQLVLIGPGFKLGLPNGNPDLQANSEMATVNRIQLDAGSEGTVIYGLRIDYANSSSEINVNVSGIIIEGNFFDGTQVYFASNSILSVSNVLIHGNYFDGANAVVQYSNSTVRSYNNIQITNNYFEDGGVDLDDGTTAMSNCTVAFNVFNSDGNNCNVISADVRDNIFNDPTATITTTQNNIHHNLAAGVATLPGGNDNVNGVLMSAIFVGAGSEDAMWTLQAGVDALYPASDATERGIFGGADPYVLSGIPPVPTIYHLLSPTNAQAGTPLQVEISTRSND